MRNSAALDQFDGVGDDLVGEAGGDVHELELIDVDTWEDETSVGDPAPAPAPAAPAAKKATPAKKAAAKKAPAGRGGRK